MGLIKQKILYILVFLVLLQVVLATPQRPVLYIGKLFINNNLVLAGDDVVVVAKYQDNFLDAYDFMDSELDLYKLEIPIDTNVVDGYAFLGAEINIYVNDVLITENPFLIPSYVDKDFILKDLYVNIEDYGDNGSTDKDSIDEENINSDLEQDDTSSTSSTSSSHSSSGSSSGVTTMPLISEDVDEDNTQETTNGNIVSDSESNSQVNSYSGNNLMNDDSIDNSITLSTSELNKITAQVIIDKITKPKVLITSGAILFIIISLMVLILLDKKKL